MPHAHATRHHHRTVTDRSSSSPSPGDNLAPDTTATTTTLTAVANAVATVNAYANALNQTVLTPIPGAGNWFADFNASLGVAQSHGNTWLQTLGPQAFSQVPQAIMNYSDIFNNATTDVLNLLATISGTPTPKQRNSIVQLLSATLTELTTTQDKLGQIQTSLQGFTADVQSDFTALNSGQTSAENEVAIDTIQLKIIQSQINATNVKIKADSNKALASEIGLGVAIFVTIAAVALAVATDGATAPLIVAGIGVLGVGGAIAGTVIFSEDVKADYQQLEQEQSSLTDEQRQVSALKGLITASTELLAESKDAQSAMASLLDAWAVLVAKLQSVVTDVTDAEAADLPALIATLDLQTAQTAWTQLTAFCQGMQTSGASIPTNTVVQPGSGITDDFLRQNLRLERAAA